MFDPWGRRTVTAGTDVTTVGFTGHRAHTSAALALYRGYDAGLARWVSEDPLGVEGGVNLGQYVLSWPLVYYDPDGESPAATAIAGVWAGGAFGGPAGAVVGGIVGGAIGLVVGTELVKWLNQKLAEHTKGKSPSTEEKHEQGDERMKDKGGEKADWPHGPRRPPRNPPRDWKGPWPPKCEQ